MFQYLSFEKSMIMYVIMFFAVIGIFKTVEMFLGKQFLTFQTFFFLLIVVLFSAYFKR